MAASKIKDEDFKLPLRQWLIKQINSKNFLELDWLDENRKTFKIPWTAKHYPNWEEHFQIFIAWSQHRGSYDPTNIDEKKLKGNFRCALNKSDDFEELKEESKLKQQTNNYRVYRVLQPAEVIAIKEKNRKRKLSTKKQPNSLTNPPNEKIPTTESSAVGTSNWFSENPNIIAVDPNVSPSTYEDTGFTLFNNPLATPQLEIIGPADLNLIGTNMNELNHNLHLQNNSNLPMSSSNMYYNNNIPPAQGDSMGMQTGNNIQAPFQTNPVAVNNFTPVQQISDSNFSPQPLSPSDYVIMESPGGIQTINQTPAANSNQNEIADQTLKQFLDINQVPVELLSMFHIHAKYDKTIMLSKDHDLNDKTRLLYGASNLQKAIYDALSTKKNVQGLFDLPYIELPEYSGKNKHIPTILEKTDLGIVFSFKNGVLYGQRFCQSQVFYYNNLTSNPEATKMNRGEETELFSFKSYITKLLKTYKENHSKRLEVDSSVTLVIGVKPNLKVKQHYPVTLILEPMLEKNLQNIFNPGGTSLAMSDANSLDNLIRAVSWLKT